jgi:hypothetical protein
MSVMVRLKKALGQTNEPTVRRTTESVADALSGAFGHRIVVKTRADGATIALIPAADLTACGIAVTESVVRGFAPVLSGSPPAVENAERRVARRAGVASAKLEGYYPSMRLCAFVLHGEVPQA